jgi:hypothetical protein
MFDQEITKNKVLDPATWIIHLIVSSNFVS